ncbi:MAG: metal ABC transporter substrate-binding protein, partial [Synergistaceae bacterium]|nr:metal ABC transporter substrate-binding protein [Synergistaceae bacterium]
MRKNSFVVIAVLALAAVLFTGAAFAAESRTRLKIIASAVPHAELLEFVKPKLAAKGIDIEVSVIEEGAGARLYNEQTHNGEFDVNFAQHVPYLTSVKTEQAYDLAPAGAIHVEPIGFYSAKYKTRAEIPDNAKIAVPNNATNEYRALRILEQNGFLKLKPEIQNFSATKDDIAKYVKPVEIIEL